MQVLYSSSISGRQSRCQAHSGFRPRTAPPGGGVLLIPTRREGGGEGGIGGRVEEVREGIVDMVDEGVVW